jgi:Mn2+/Fe2+ NRAMP family transporter
MIGMRTLLSRDSEPSRRARRVIVVAAFAAIPVAVVTLAVGGRIDWPLPIGLLAFVLPLVLVSIPLLALQEFRRNVMRRSGPDERERQRRDEAYRVSYRIIEMATLVGLLAAVWFRAELAAILSYDWFLIFGPLYGYVIFLPYAVFAWREPDPVD